MIKAVDLFCGAGGLTHGLERSGIDVVAGYDIDASCRYAYETNNNAVFLKKSVTDIEADELLSYFGDAEYSLLAGCAPCQPFSTYSRGKANPDKDERWSLLMSFESHIRSTLPDFVTMENVRGLMKQQIFFDFIESLTNLGYHTDYKVVFCPDYGMAQRRERLVLLASRLGEIKLIEPTHNKETYVKTKDIIRRVKPISAGESDPKDLLHRSSALSELNMKRIRASKPGGSWRDWPEELVADCHKKDSGKTYSSVYGRMSWDDLAPTITTQCTGFGNGRFGHPEQDRAISLREAAMLQSFPKSYKFWPKQVPLETRAVSRMIGNAVPVRLGEVVGESIKKHLEQVAS